MACPALRQDCVIGPDSAHPAKGVVVGVGERLVELFHPELGDLVIGPGVLTHRDGHFVAQGAGVLGQVPVLSNAVLGVAQRGLQGEPGGVGGCDTSGQGRDAVELWLRR